jgi:UDP-N-acetylglucosamine 4-epimerase
VTGAAGFIGSHLLEVLLKCGQKVIAVDNFSTGRRDNIEEVKESVGAKAWEHCTFVEGSVCDFELMNEVCQGVDVVLHQAALGSVPRSIEQPVQANEANVSGFVTLLTAAKNQGVTRFVYASSSSVYGDDHHDMKSEDNLGRLLSPYAVTKRVNELYAGVFSSLFPIVTIGLRYFNVFGPRQDPNGAYAAVIPRWIKKLKSGEQCEIFGDGTTSRDFTFVDNVLFANILASKVSVELFGESVTSSVVINIACEKCTSLNSLYQMIKASVIRWNEERGLLLHNSSLNEPNYRSFRVGDIKHSLADTSRAHDVLGFVPVVSVEDGIARTVNWYLDNKRF